MGLKRWVRAVLDEGSRIVHECRRCGATLETAADSCPYCGPTDVATFETE